MDGFHVPELQRMANANKHNNERAAEVYAAYQENIRRANMIKSEIVTGLQSGADPTLLLLKAVEAIARMTDDTVFEKTVRRTLDGRTAK